MKIARITIEAQYEEAVSEIARLMKLNPAPGSDEADRLGVLAVLVDSYERTRYPLATPDSVVADAARRWRDARHDIATPDFIGSRLERMQKAELALLDAIRETDKS